MEYPRNVQLELLQNEGIQKNNEICKFCTPNPYGHGEAISNLIHRVFNDKTNINVYVYKDSLYLSAYPSPEDTKLAKHYTDICRIKYCPMCGKIINNDKI